MPVSGNLYYSEHCERATERPPVILIHGAGGTHLYWPPEIRRLPGYCVFAVDLPGHGKSSTMGGQQTIDEYSRSLSSWLEANKLGKVILVGHSMGGAIALSLALQQPEHVLGLGLISTGARLRVHPEILSYAIDRTTFHKAAELLVSFSFSSHAPERLVELASRRMLDTRQSVLYGDLLACDHFDMLDQLGSIQQSTLVICGSDDQLTPLRYAQYLSRNIPHAQLEVVQDAGHMVMLEQPQQIADSLLSFLIDISYHPGEGS